jgi:hypothetical protein
VFPDGHAEGRIISSIRGFSAFNDPETFTADEVTLELVGNLAPGAAPVSTIFDMRRVVFAGLVIDKKPLVITRGDLDDTVFKRPLGAKVAVTSFVKSFRHDGQVKQGNSLWVKGFGTLFFGEVWGDQYIRSVSMVRMELGCTVGGNGNLGGGQPQPSTGL